MNVLLRSRVQHDILNACDSGLGLTQPNLK